MWPIDVDELVALQERIARLEPERWVPPPDPEVGGCFVCFGRGGEGPGSEGDQGWAGAVAGDSEAVVGGAAGAPYRPGLLAAREGALLERALRALGRFPDVLLVNAVGRDHPRRAGLALHLGWVLDVPTVGVTHRPLVAEGPWPEDQPGASAPPEIDGDQVGAWVRTRVGARPLAVSAGWRTDVDVAVGAVLTAVGRARTPEPIRRARELARRARSGFTRA